MTEHKIMLVVEGMDRDDGHVRFEVFVEQLQKLQSALSKSDKLVSGGKRSSHFTVVGLSHASPATVILEAHSNPESRDMRHEALSRFTGLIDAVERNEIPRDVDYSLLEDIRALASPVGTSIKVVTLKINGGSFDLTRTIANRIDSHLAEQEECFTTVEGMLEKANVHDDANVFTIYPDVGAPKISCHLRQEIVEKAISALRRRVAVSGLAQYRKYSPYPHRIAVEQIDIFGPEEELPTFDHLKGIAPDSTGSLSSEDYVREMRDAWQ